MLNKKDFEIRDEESSSEQGNHMTLGIAFGTLAGSVGMMILSTFGHIGWGVLCIGIGLLGGMIIGVNIPKKK